MADDVKIPGIPERVPEPGFLICPDCKGRGTRNCHECDGSGVMIHECDRGYEHEESCDYCDEGQCDCPECDGSGEVDDPDYDVDVGL